MDYLTLKLIHQTCAALSVTGFAARGIGALKGAPWVRSRVARTLPHMVDTTLLASALAMAWMLKLSPMQAPWLAAKIIALLAYIGFGMLALKPGRPPALRATAFVAALVTFGYIVSVALTKDARGFLGVLI